MTNDFQEWYSISGSIYTDEQTAWYLWQTVIAYMKKTEFKTKKKAQLEATADENKSEVIEYLRDRKEQISHEVTEWMKTQFLATAKAREILEDFEEGKENTGERE